MLAMDTSDRHLIRDSVSVVLTTCAGSILLQHRDDTPNIEYPGYWGLIAGWVEIGEDPLAALRRELHEEFRTLGGHDLSFGPISFLGCDDRVDRPWTEYVFHAYVLTPTEQLRIYEGREFDVFTFDKCTELDRLAPHHRQYLSTYRHQIESKSFTLLAVAEEEEKLTMRAIEEYIEISQLGLAKDYEALERGNGFVVSSTSCPTAAIHTSAEARFIALLEFKHDVPRGNHYHLRKVEHMVVLSGTLRCSFALPEDSSNTIERVLEPGQMVRILPGCVHTYTALEGNALALEYAPQRYEASDVIVI
jgi:8-oxo-dGTP pyrophosphatase MutT (NUDIX family)